MAAQNRRILLGLVALIPLSLTFIIVCVLLSVKRNDPLLLKSKLRIGALLLTLTTFSAQGTFGQPTCYERAEVTYFLMPVGSVTGQSAVEQQEGVFVSNPTYVYLLEGTAEKIIFFVEERYSYYKDIGFALVPINNDNAAEKRATLTGLLKPLEIDTGGAGRYLQFDVPKDLKYPDKYRLDFDSVYVDTDGTERNRAFFYEIYITMENAEKWAELGFSDN